MPARVTVHVRGLDRLVRKLGRGALLHPALRTFLRDAALFAERAAREGAPYDTGALRRSIVSEVQPLQARVSSPLAYAAVMEAGRRPGSRMPPPQALVGWMRRHGVTVAPFVLARAIQRRGIRGRFYMRRAAERLHAALPGMVRELGQRIAQEWGR